MGPRRGKDDAQEKSQTSSGNYRAGLMFRRCALQLFRREWERATKPLPGLRRFLRSARPGVRSPSKAVPFSIAFAPTRASPIFCGGQTSRRESWSWRRQGRGQLVQRVDFYQSHARRIVKPAHERGVSGWRERVTIAASRSSIGGMVVARSRSVACRANCRSTDRITVSVEELEQWILQLTGDA